MHFSWVGPFCILSSISYVYYRNHSGGAPSAEDENRTFFLSTKMCVCAWFLVYLSGVLPKTKLFPPAFYDGNIFKLLYRYVYCSEGVGYRYVRPLLHQHNPFLHSDYRPGVRVLYHHSSPRESAYRYKQGPLWAAKMEQGQKRSAAQHASASQQYRENQTEANRAKPFATYRGDDYVDLLSLPQRKEGEKGNGLIVVPVPMYNDNYAYLLLHLDTHKVVAVDPADPEPVLQMVERVQQWAGHKVELTEILLTHKHWDHVGGIKAFTYLKGLQAGASPTPEEGHALLEKYKSLVSPDLKVIGSDYEATMGVDTPIPRDAYQLSFDPSAMTALRKDNYLTIGGGKMGVSVFHLPGHTRGHVCYLVGDMESGPADSDPSNRYCALFTGDVLFSGGIGGLFELRSVKELLHSQDAFLGVSPKAENTDGKECTGCVGISYPSFWKGENGECEKVKDENIFLYVGHEYTENIMSQILEIMTRHCVGLSQNPSVEVSSSVKEGLTLYKNYLESALDEVKLLRRCTDGLQHVHEKGAHTLTKLPNCTVPSTLYLEKRINPLLTLNRTVLELLLESEKECEKEGEHFAKTEIDSAIYSSPHRSVPPGTL